MENKKLLIGAGVVVVAYLLWKKSQSNSVANSNIITPQYSKECYDSLKIALQQENVKSPDFEKTFLEKCEKTKNKIQKDSLGQPKVMTEGIFKPKIFTGDSINPNNQNAPRIVNDIAIDKLPNIINQEDIQLFLFNNSNISSIEDNTIRDAKGYPIYTKLRKSDVKKDIFGNIVSGNANEGNFYKENGKYYLNTPTSAGSEICEISEKDYFDFFVNIKEGSYKKIISPTIQKNNCSFKFSSSNWGR
jgi:hypothetical protein